MLIFERRAGGKLAGLIAMLSLTVADTEEIEFADGFLSNNTTRGGKKPGKYGREIIWHLAIECLVFSWWL